MKVHRAWIRTTAAVAFAAVGTQFAVGQYAPYSATPQYPQASQANTVVAPYGVPQVQQVPTYPVAPQAYPAAPQAVPQAPPAQQQVSYPMAPAAQVTYPQAPQPAAQATIVPRYAPQQTQPQYVPQPTAAPQYQAPVAAQRPSYPAVANRPDTHAAHNGNATPPPSEPLPTPANGVTNGNGATSTYDPSYNGGYPTAGGCNCSSYPSAGGYYGAYGGEYGGTDYGLGGYMNDYDDGGSQWFGGVYSLYMTRSKPAYRRYTVGVDSVAEGASPANPYFPTSADTENESDCTYLVPDWRWGYEIRLGSTFDFGEDCDTCDYGNACGCDGGACGGCNSCDTCCAPCCTQTYAWEVAFWSLDRDVQNQYVDGPLTPNFRYYGMVNYAGLEYDDGTNGLNPVNTYYNYQIPITGTGDFGPGTDQVVLAQRVRTNFWAQNLELNFLRLPFFSGGCDPCGCDPCAPSFTLTGLCGVRYFRVDDDFEFGTEWGTFGDSPDGWDYNSPNELYHDINVENHLVGFQLGANMNYCLGRRWNAFWDTNFGLYNNYMTQNQSIYNGAGLPVVFTQDGREATVVSKKNDVAFLGEMRLGGAFNFTEHCRGVLAYRAIAISGLALSQDQIKPEYSNWADTARINADGSIIIHGVQTGVEFCY